MTSGARPRLLHHCLRETAARTPDAVAVVDGSRSTTFAELDQASDRLAQVILSAGATPGQPVGVHAVKSIEAIVALHGALKAGTPYVPIDPAWPAARRATVLQDSGASTVVCDRVAGLAEVADGLAPTATVVELSPGADAASDATFRGRRRIGAEEVAAAPGGAPEVGLCPGDPAYVLYTSGSTGRPKGVVVSHRAARAFVDWAVGEFGVGGDDRLSSHAPLHFDLSIFDVFASAAGGASVVLVPPSATVLPAEAARFVEEQRITVWYSVPSALVMMLHRGGLARRDLSALRAVLFAGEVLPLPHLRTLREVLPHARLANLYGPTETNVCTHYDVPPAPELPEEVAPIGRALPGTEVFALTDDGTVAAPGETGELLVCGPTVMSGYWGRPERTAQVLVPDPRPGRSGVAYRTGDVVELGHDGNYRYRGRRDDQVKSRGFRIELGEVERAIDEHPDVVECAAVAVPDELVTNRLRAFVVTADGTVPDDLRASCGRRLPAHMMPERFTAVPALPRTSNGKVDRAALIDLHTEAEGA